MEAISVRERAQKVMNSIDSADGHNSIDSADGNRRRSVYQSGNGRRLEMAPLKMMRRALSLMGDSHDEHWPEDQHKPQGSKGVD